MYKNSYFFKEFNKNRAFVLVVIAVMLPLILYFHQCGINDNLAKQSKALQNIYDRHINSLKDELNLITNNLDDEKSINSLYRISDKFDALFYIDSNTTHKIKGSKFNLIDDFDAKKFGFDKDGFYISELIFIDKIYRFFIIKDTGRGAFLAAFVNSDDISSILNSSEFSAFIADKAGHFLGFESVYEIYGSEFDYKKLGKAQILTNRAGKREVVFIQKFENSPNFLVIKKKFFDVFDISFLLYILLYIIFATLVFVLVLSARSSKKRVYSYINNLQNMLDNPGSNHELRLDSNGDEIVLRLADSIQVISELTKQRKVINRTFEDIFKDSSLCALIVSGKNGEIISASKEAMKIYGSDIVSKFIFDIKPQNLYDELISVHKAGFYGENQIIMSHKTKNGIKLVQLQKSIIQTQKDPFILYMVFDISRYQEFYERAHTTLDAIDFSPVLGLIYDYKNSKVINIMGNVKKAWGYDSSDIIGARFELFSLIEPSRVEKLKNELNNSIKLAKEGSYEFTKHYKILHADKNYYFYRIFIKLIYIADEPHFIFYYQNIHDTIQKESEFQENLRVYTNIIDARNFISWQINLASSSIVIDDRFLKLLGYYDKYQKENFLLQEFYSFINQKDLGNFKQSLNNYVNGLSDKFVAEFRIKDRLGSEIWLSMVGRILSRDENSIPKFSGVMENITEKKRSQLRLNLMASVFSYSHEGIILLDEHGGILEVNGAFERITGYFKDEVKGRVPKFLYSGVWSEFLTAFTNLIRTNGFYKGEVIATRKDGSTYPVLLNISSLKEENKITHYLVMFLEITGIKEKEARLEAIAHYDALTKLPNRIYFENIADKIMQRSKQTGELIAVLFIDFDGFKGINDNFGHNIGDIYLMQISTALKKAMRQDDILARLGGDEFGAILVGLRDKNSINEMLERLIAAAGTKFKINDNIVGASASIGAHFYQGENTLFSELLARADKAMYGAKLSGKNRYRIYDESDKTSGMIDFAMRVKNGEFFTLYQPIIFDDTIYGFELLLRRNHLNLGVLSPGEFLFDMKDEEIQRALSIFVLRENLKFQKEINSKFVSSINVSVDDLVNREFLECLREGLEKWALKGENFIFEIIGFDENEREKFIRVFAEYDKLGVKFALNNANLQNLRFIKNIPFHLIKIDRNLCLNLLNDDENIKMLKAIFTYVNKNNYIGIAQGIESERAFRTFKSIGFKYMQGNFVSEPLSRANIAKFLSDFESNVIPEALNRDEFIVAVKVAEYERIVGRFLSGSRQDGNLDDKFASEFRKFLASLNSIQNLDKVIFTEINKQILDILTLNKENFSDKIIEFKDEFEKLIRRFDGRTTL